MTDHRFFKLIPQAELLKRWGISEETLRTWRKKGMIRATKLGSRVFYDPDEIQAFVDGQKESSAVRPLRRGRNS